MEYEQEHQHVVIAKKVFQSQHCLRRLRVLTHSECLLRIPHQVDMAEIREANLREVIQISKDMEVIDEMARDFNLKTKAGEAELDRNRYELGRTL